MKKYKVKINKIELNNNNFIISTENNLEFKSIIKKGSVNFKIFNESNREIYLGDLEVGDNIKIFGIEDSKEEKKYIIINKIITKNKYVFNSESSEDFEIIE